MVDYTYSLDNIFASLSDATRRDILIRVSDNEMSVSEIAKSYKLTLAAVSKHLKVLEKARLIKKRRSGKEQMVSLSLDAFVKAEDYLDFYRKFWDIKLDSLEDYLKH